VSELDTAIQRYRQAPRVVQWALLATAGLVLYFAWEKGIYPITARWNRDAVAIESKVTQVRASGALADDLLKMKPLVTGIGPVSVPAGESAGFAAFTDVVNTVLEEHRIGDQNRSFDLRSRGNLPKTALTSMNQGKRVERLTGDLKFNATPEEAIAVIAALESSPDIEQINSVRITKDAGGKVKVQLALEAWVLAAETAKAGPV